MHAQITRERDAMVRIAEGAVLGAQYLGLDNRPRPVQELLSVRAPLSVRVAVWPAENSHLPPFRRCAQQSTFKVEEKWQEHDDGSRSVCGMLTLGKSFTSPQHKARLILAPGERTARASITII